MGLHQNKKLWPLISILLLCIFFLLICCLLTDCSTSLWAWGACSSCSLTTIVSPGQGGWFWFLSGSWANEPSSSCLRFHSMLSKECRPPKIRVIWFSAFGCVVCAPGSCLVECAALTGCIGALALSFFSLPLGSSFWNCLFSVERDLAQQDSAPHGLKKTENSCLDLSYWAPEVSL